MLFSSELAGLTEFSWGNDLLYYDPYMILTKTLSVNLDLSDMWSDTLS